LANSLVFIVLLAEISKLYARVLLAVRAPHREREARIATGDAIAAMIAHEVKQPLSAMLTRAETSVRWLGHPDPDLGKTKATLQHLVADGHRAAAIIERVRANFRKEAQIRSSIDLNGLVGETIELLGSELEHHRIEVTAEPDPKLPQVSGDRIQLQQVLVNLITNAIDSMARDGREPRVLVVRSELRHDDHVVILVSDTGPGVTAQDADLIFDPLFTTKPSGMGMGLAICRSIVEAHRGSLRLANDDPKGATFQIVLPTAADTGIW
jgi:C4-dicarboxylate-specific signal transduction histidine kinase